MRVLSLASLLVLAAIPFLAPHASATTCAQTWVHQGDITVFRGEIGTGCLDGWVYTCEPHYYGGGHSLPVWECTATYPIP